MKRGRPNVRNKVKLSILGTLEKAQVPLTTSSIKGIVSKELNQDFSWNTVQKYLNELMQTNKVSALNLPHSKISNKTGLTLYTLKK